MTHRSSVKLLFFVALFLFAFPSSSQPPSIPDTNTLHKAKEESKGEHGGYKKNNNKKKTDLSRVLLLTPAFPWQFGPYQQQQRLLGEQLVSRNVQVFWNAAFRPLPSSRKYSPVEAVRACGPNPPPMPTGKDLKIAEKFTYLGVQLPKEFQGLGRGVLASAVNKQLKKYKIDAIICLIDANQVFMDVPFAAFSIIWFPNHFSSLVPRQRMALLEFDVVAALAPGDAMMLSDPSHGLKQVVTIPHIIERPLGLTTEPKEVLRKKYGLPVEAWVIMVNCGNYEMGNRKSLDIILLAFKAFQQAVPNAFLYLKAISTREILLSEGFPRDQPSKESGLQISELLDVVDLPEHSFTLETRILDHMAAWELMLCSDTLLMPSKTEGFGLPMLEAQLLGVPVVTTRFGAMKDYTINGISVPPLQPVYLEGGMVAMPDLNGVISALKMIHSGGPLASSVVERNLTAEAIEYISKELSREAVASRFYRLIQDGISGQHRESLSLKGFDFSSYTNNWYFSLPHDDPKLLKILLQIPTRETPRWVLLWSSSLQLRHSELSRMGDRGWASSPPVDGDIFLLQAMLENGAIYPSNNDILLNQDVKPDGPVLIRTETYLTAAKFVMARAGKQPNALSVLETILRGGAPVPGGVSVKYMRAVVADKKLMIDAGGDPLDQMFSR